MLFNAYAIGLNRANAYMQGALRSMMSVSEYADMKNLKIGEVWYTIGKYRYNLIDASVSELIARLNGDITDVMFPDAVLFVGDQSVSDDIVQLARDNKLDIIILHNDGSLTVDDHYTSDAIHDVEGLTLNHGRVGFNNIRCKTAHIRAIAYLLKCHLHDAIETDHLCYSLKTSDGRHFVYGRVTDLDDPFPFDVRARYHYYTEHDLEHVNEQTQHRLQKIERVIANDLLGPQWYTCEYRQTDRDKDIDSYWSLLLDVVQICNKKRETIDRLFDAIHTAK